MQRHVSYLHRIPFGLQPTHGKDLFDDTPHEEVWMKNPFVWTRRFVFVKDADPAGPNYAVVRDDLTGNTELDPNLNLWCLASAIDTQNNVVHYTGQHGVDLYCYVAEPATFSPVTRTVGHPCGFGFAAHYKELMKKDFREDQIQCRIPQAKRDGGYFVALVPVKQGEAAPKFETVAGGAAIRVTFAGGRVDTVISRNATGALDIDGTTVNAASAVVTRSADGAVTVTEPAP
jgi:hypothetical protein